MAGAKRFKVWEKRGIGGQWGDSTEIQARGTDEAAATFCKTKGYRTPLAYTRDTFRVHVTDGARVFMHYIRVSREP